MVACHTQSGSAQSSNSHLVWICSILTYASEMDQLNPLFAQLIWICYICTSTSGQYLLNPNFLISRLDLLIWPASPQSPLPHLIWICSILTFSSHLDLFNTLISIWLGSTRSSRSHLAWICSILAFAFGPDLLNLQFPALMELKIVYAILFKTNHISDNIFTTTTHHDTSTEPTYLHSPRVSNISKKSSILTLYSPRTGILQKRKLYG